MKTSVSATLAGVPSGEQETNTWDWPGLTLLLLSRSQFKGSLDLMDFEMLWNKLGFWDDFLAWL